MKEGFSTWACFVGTTSTDHFLFSIHHISTSSHRFFSSPYFPFLILPSPFFPLFQTLHAWRVRVKEKAYWWACHVTGVQKWHVRPIWCLKKAWHQKTDLKRIGRYSAWWSTCTAGLGVQLVLHPPWPFFFSLSELLPLLHPTLLLCIMSANSETAVGDQPLLLRGFLCFGAFTTSAVRWVTWAIKGSWHQCPILERHHNQLGARIGAPYRIGTISLGS